MPCGVLPPSRAALKVAGVFLDPLPNKGNLLSVSQEPSPSPVKMPLDATRAKPPPPGRGLRAASREPQSPQAPPSPCAFLAGSIQDHDSRLLQGPPWTTTSSQCPDRGAMPGEQPRQAPPPTMTRDLQPCQAAGGTGGSSQPPGEDGAPASRPTKATGNGAQAVEPPETRPWQAGDVEPKAPLLRTQSLSSLPGKGGSPRAPPGRGYAQALPQQASRADGSPQQLYTLSISGSRDRKSVV